MSVHRRDRRRAFTLLEMVVSISLFVTVMSLTFAFYRRSINERESGTEASRNVQLARVVLERIANELRQSVGFMPGYGTGVYGLEDRIEIQTVTIPDKKLSEKRSIQDTQLPGQFDLQQIRYYIAYDENPDHADSNGYPPALGLVRRVNRTLLRDVVFVNDEEQQTDAADDAELAWKEELYAPEIKYIQFLYYDGARWWDSWELTNMNALPQMVMVTIGFIPEPPKDEEFEIVDENFLKDETELEPLPEDRYSIMVRIPQSDVFFGSRISREASAASEAAAAGKR